MVQELKFTCLERVRNLRIHDMRFLGRNTSILLRITPYVFARQEVKRSWVAVLGWQAKRRNLVGVWSFILARERDHDLTDSQTNNTRRAACNKSSLDIVSEILLVYPPKTA
jgi:hypothetical protein